MNGELGDDPTQSEERSSSRQTAIFCSFLWPKYPGHSGGEIRDFHLLSHLSSFLDVHAVASHHAPSVDQKDLLRPRMAAVYQPAPVHQPPTLRPGRISRFRRFLRKARDRGWPILGFRYHYDAEVHLDGAVSCLPLLCGLIKDHQPDFIIVSPQINAAGLLLRESTNARVILASYDVEAIRMQRLAKSETGVTRLALAIEARRASRFETDNLRCFDGVIAVSPHDASEFVRRYELDPNRVVAIDNSVDAEYFDFRPRVDTLIPTITYVGNFGYSPNAQAAIRLLRRIAPRIRQSYPNVVMRVVGDNPTKQMLAEHDGCSVIVTGRVPDIRAELALAMAGCFPLLAGSGTKFKVLECLASGVPLVCSSIALEGLDIIPGEHALRADTDEAIAAATCALINDKLERQRLAANARALIESRYTWTSALAALAPWLARIGSLPKQNQANGNS